MPPKVVRGTIAKLAHHFGAVVGSTDATRPFKTFVVEVIPLHLTCPIPFVSLLVVGVLQLSSPRLSTPISSAAFPRPLGRSASAEWIVYKRSNDETLYIVRPPFPFPFSFSQVVDLKRHLVDAEFEGAVKQAPDTAFNFAYDLIVSDGARKVRWFKVEFYLRWMRGASNL